MRATAAPRHLSCNLPETVDGNGADSVGSERTRWTAQSANSSRMWKPVHEVLLDRDNSLLLMRSPTAIQWTRLGNAGRGFVVTSGPGFGKRLIHDFYTLLVFHD